MADLARDLAASPRWQWRDGALARILGAVLRVCRVGADGLLHGTDQSGARRRSASTKTLTRGSPSGARR